MSLILDALRKSEAERRRGQTPGLFTPVPTQTASVQRRTFVWQWLIAATLIIAVTLAWWYRPVPLPTLVVVAPQPTTPIAATPAINTPGVVTPTTITHALPTPLAPAPVVVAPQRPFFAEPASFPPPPPATPAPVVADVPVLDLPTLAMLDPSERAALPPLKLSMHVWAENPGTRMAIIDGQRVTEGSTIGSSVVAEIRHDGVVLDLHGRRFLLPRP